MRKALTAAVFAALWLAAAPGRADVASGWQAFLDGDYETAIAELEPAAQSGDATAQYYLGVLYDHREGVARNYRTSADR